MKYVIDSYTWIEYFMGSRMGETVKSLIENTEEKFTPTTCLVEVYSKTLKVENQEPAKKQKAYIKERSALVFLDETIAVESARLNVRMRKEIDGLFLADSIVYGTAAAKKAEVVTGDEPFKKLENVLFIK